MATQPAVERKPTVHIHMRGQPIQQQNSSSSCCSSWTQQDAVPVMALAKCWRIHFVTRLEKKKHWIGWYFSIRQHHHACTKCSLLATVCDIIGLLKQFISLNLIYMMHDVGTEHHDAWCKLVTLVICWCLEACQFLLISRMLTDATLKKWTRVMQEEPMILTWYYCICSN